MVLAAKSPTSRAKMSERLRARWSERTPEQVRDHMLKMWRAIGTAKPTRLEQSVARVLDSLGISYQVQVPIDRYTVDFLVPSRNLVIECDGHRWHSSDQARAKDRRRDQLLTSLGYSILRLPERDIKARAFEPLLKAIA